MKIIKAIVTGVVLTTVVSCSSLEMSEVQTSTAPKMEAGRMPDSQKKGYTSIGIYSSGDKLKGDSYLEESLSNELYKKKIRNLTSSLILPGNEQRALKPVVKILKRDNFEAVLVIKQLEIASETNRAPSGTVGNESRETLILKKESHPLRTLTAQIDFIDLKTTATVWSGSLTFQDASSLPILIQKTAEGIADQLAQKNLIP
jgi:hypothetical protein